MDYLPKNYGEVFVVSWKPRGYPYVSQTVGVSFRRDVAEKLVEYDIKRMTRLPPREFDDYQITPSTLYR